MSYTFDWSVIWQPEVWIEAIWITLVYGLGTTIAGLALGLVLGLVLIGRFAVLRGAVSVFIGIFRCTPALIQIVWFYYAFPMVIGVNLPAWLAASFGLTFYMAAFSAEIFRGGIQSIEKGQWNACRSLCLSYSQTMIYVVLPQTARRIAPAVVNQSIIQIKNTSLLSIVSVHDIMYASSSITASTFRPLEVLTFTSLLYIAIIWPLASVAHAVEQRFSFRRA